MKKRIRPGPTGTADMLFAYIRLEAPTAGKERIMEPVWTIKSFKHNGSLHRMWLNNWPVPAAQMDARHRNEGMLAFVNVNTPIVEADGKRWVSRVPGVSFFIPKQWYNIVALIEEEGIRYYCNAASPPHASGHVLTYIDYDLDVIRLPGGARHVVDQDEFEQHSVLYYYSSSVKEKVLHGLDGLLRRMDGGGQPFDDALVRQYYELWKQRDRKVRE